MNFKSNKGYTGADISIALIILLIFIPTIGAIIFNITLANNNTKRKVVAMNFATSILELAKETDYDKLKLEAPEEQGGFSYKINEKFGINDSQNGEFSLKDENNTSYKVKVTITKYVDTEEYTSNHSSTDEKKDLVKTIATEVEYPIGNETKKINVSTVIEKK